MEKNRSWILFVCAFVLLFSSGCHSIKKQDSTNRSQKFHWIRKESGFVDYTISNNTIQFRYTICFENNSEDNITLSYLCAKFQKSELSGWLKYEKFYDGTLENGGVSITIKAGEKVNVTYVFSGEYLGGPVYENLSVPDITMIQDYEHRGHGDGSLVPLRP